MMMMMMSNGYVPETKKGKMMNNNAGTLKRYMYVCVHLSSVTFDIGNVCRANFKTISGENVPSLIPEEDTSCSGNDSTVAFRRDLNRMLNNRFFFRYVLITTVILVHIFRKNLYHAVCC